MPDINLDDFMKGRADKAKEEIVSRYGPGILKDVALGLELLASYVQQAPTLMDKLTPFDLVLLGVAHGVHFQVRDRIYTTDGKRAWFCWPQGDEGYTQQLMDTSFSVPIDLTSTLGELAYQMEPKEVEQLKQALIDKFAREAEQKNTF